MSPKTWNDRERGFLQASIIGEGCFSISEFLRKRDKRNPQLSYRAFIDIKNTDKDFIDYIKYLVPESSCMSKYYYCGGEKRVIYSLRIYKKSMIYKTIIECSPWFGKKKQSETMLEYLNLVGYEDRRRLDRRTTPDIIPKLHELFLQMCMLNSRKIIKNRTDFIRLPEELVIKAASPPKIKEGLYLCGKCKQYFKKDSFHRNRAGRFGIENNCKKCISEYKKNKKK